MCLACLHRWWEDTWPLDDKKTLATSIDEVKEDPRKLYDCDHCGSFSENRPCTVCGIVLCWACLDIPVGCMCQVDPPPAAAEPNLHSSSSYGRPVQVPSVDGSVVSLPSAGPPHSGNLTTVGATTKFVIVLDHEDEMPK